MSLKNSPSSLFHIAIQSVVNAVLKNWRESYFMEYSDYKIEFKKGLVERLPDKIYNQLFDHMLDTHARIIQNNKDDDRVPGISSLIYCVLMPNLHRLTLNGLRHIGRVNDEEIQCLENILLNELSNLNNLVEISLKTSGEDFTLPTCSDEVMDKIGKFCPNLKTLDVSFNHTVTDEGLNYLIPSDCRQGCILLRKISLFECSVTVVGVSNLIRYLPDLKFVEYRETGQALKYLEKYGLFGKNKLKLVHINNLGTKTRTIKDFFELKCDKDMINTLCHQCPKLTTLKVRVDESEVKFLHSLKDLNVLDLIYNLGTPLSPGSNTLQLLTFIGTQLFSLSFVCDIFTKHHLKAVCEQCCNLKRLWIKTNLFEGFDSEITSSEKSKCSLLHLEFLYLKEINDLCIPLSIIIYIVHKSCALKELYLSMGAPDFSDSYVQELFWNIETSSLKQIMFLLPTFGNILSSLNITVSTVDMIIDLCPELERLGNLKEWNVTLEEVQELKFKLKSSNSLLNIVYS